MALTHLVDTSVLTRVSTPAVCEELERYLTNGMVARGSVSDQEIGLSARNAHEWDPLNETISVFPLVETMDVRVRRSRNVQ